MLREFLPCVAKWLYFLGRDFSDFVAEKPS